MKLTDKQTDGNNFCPICGYPLAIFCDHSGGKYQPFQLADMLLEYEPDNVDALRYKYDALKYFLEFSIHEMPSGVLNGYAGASVSDIPAMIEDTNEFERISRKLNMPLCENLVKDCRRYYKAYGDYFRISTDMRLLRITCARIKLHIIHIHHVTIMNK